MIRLISYVVMNGVVYEDKHMPFSTVYMWFTTFSSGQESVKKNTSYSGRSKSAISEPNISKKNPLQKKICVSLSDRWNK